MQWICNEAVDEFSTEDASRNCTNTHQSSAFGSGRIGNNPDLDGLVHSTTNHGSGRGISNLYVSENWREQQQKNVNNENHCFGRIFTNFPIELNRIELSHARNISNNSIFMAVNYLIGSEMHCSDSCHQMFIFCDGLVAVDIKCSECGCCGFIEMMKRSEW